MPPPGWYPDHEAATGHVRYWDGVGWTEKRESGPPRRAPEPGAARWWLERFLASLAVAAVVVLIALVFATNQPPTEQQVSQHTTKIGRARPATSPEAAAAPDPAPVVAPESLSPVPPARSAASSTYEVRKVLDGDTLRLTNGVQVRLVGVDAPVAGECGAKDAARLLDRLVGGRKVTLRRPGADKDSAGHLLRYVVIGRTDVGLRMVRSGLVSAEVAFTSDEEHPREADYLQAQAHAPTARATACDS